MRVPVFVFARIAPAVCYGVNMILLELSAAEVQVLISAARFVRQTAPERIKDRELLAAQNAVGHVQLTLERVLRQQSPFPLIAPGHTEFGRTLDG